MIPRPKKQQQLNLFLIILFLLNIWDLGITQSLLKHFGYENELNPFVQHLYLLNPQLVSIYKMSTLFLFIVIIKRTALKNYRFAYHSTQIVTAIFFIIGLYHLINLFLLSSIFPLKLLLYPDFDL